MNWWMFFLGVIVTLAAIVLVLGPGAEDDQHRGGPA
jgi:hypothetical protein